MQVRVLPGGPIMQKILENNIWKYTILLVANKRTFVAILAVFYLTIPGVSTADIGLIFLIGMITGFILEIPSGYLSDKWGHKEALVLSRALMTLSTIAFIFANSFAMLIVAAILMNAAMAFMSGTGSAFMHETLRALGKEDRYAHIIGRARSIGFAIPALVTVAVPFLVPISYRLPFIVALVIDLIGLVTVLSLVKPSVAPVEIKEIGITNFKDVIRSGLQMRFLRYAVFGSILSGAMMTFGVYRSPYQEFVGIAVIWFGVLFGAGRLLASLLLWRSGFIKEKTTLRSFYLFELCAYILLIASLGVVTHPWVIAGIFLFANGFQWGISNVVSSYYLEIIHDSSFKATLMSISAQLRQIIAGVLGFLLGLTIEYYSYRTGFAALALILLVFGSFQYLYVLRAERGRLTAKTANPA